MSSIEGEKISTTTLLSRRIPLMQDQRILLIRNVSKYPRLYKNEFLQTPLLYRHEKQQMWDKIAEDSGFDKVEEAKSKWRCLINYLRQHLDNVIQKKQRRYIPNTNNPEDKYVQLADWPFFSELEFVVPYVKYAASRQCSNIGYRLEMSPIEMDIIIEGLETEVYRKNEQEKKQTSEEYLKQHQQTKEKYIKYDKLITPDNVDDLPEDDEILKEYFENMLKSTLKLSTFHQNRIKQQLLDCLNEQKALNKIN